MKRSVSDQVLNLDKTIDDEEEGWRFGSTYTHFNDFLLFLVAILIEYII